MRLWSVPLVVAALMCSMAGEAAGRSWRLQRTPAVPGQQDGALNAVSCASDSVCFAAGAYTNRRGFDPRPRRAMERLGLVNAPDAEPASRRWIQWRLVPIGDDLHGSGRFLIAVGLTD